MTTDRTDARPPEHCSTQVMSYLEDNRRLMGDVQTKLDSAAEKADRIIALLDDKLDRLIAALTNRNMIPVSSVGYIIIFILLFVWAVQFGEAAVQRIMGRIPPAVVSDR